VAEVIFAVDQDYKITLFNSRAEELFKIPATSAIGEDADKVMNLFINDSDKLLSVKDYCFKENPLAAFKEVGFDSEVPLKFTADFDEEGNAEYFKLNFANIKVGDKKDECVVSLSNITDEVKVDKQKDEFISIASHELKTPISIIKTNLFMFLFLFKGKLSSKHTHLAHEMEYGLTRLSKVVNNLLDISRIEQGRFILEEKEQNLDHIINETLDNFKDLVRNKKLKLYKPKHKAGKAFTDKDRFIEVLDNLLSNAFKYTDSGGIRVTILPNKQVVKISVTDTGPGISKKDQAKLFKKFGRAKEGLKREGAGASTGLGLYISKKMVHEMGGDIGLTSRAGKGSTFWFTVPRKKAVKKAGSSVDNKNKIEKIKRQVKSS
jgi:signal transduction histidine kinase